MSAEATRMQDLTSKFSKIFRGDTPDPHSGRRQPKTLVPLNFSAVVAPLFGNGNHDCCVIPTSADHTDGEATRLILFISSAVRFGILYSICLTNLFESTRLRQKKVGISIGVLFCILIYETVADEDTILLTR